MMISAIIILTVIIIIIIIIKSYSVTPKIPLWKVWEWNKTVLQ